MSFQGLLNQSITIYSKTGYNAEGREKVSSGVTTFARVQETSKRKLTPTGQVIMIDAIVYVLPSVTVNTDDKVLYDSVTYKVWSRYKVVDGAGRLHHQKLELIKWRSS